MINLSKINFRSISIVILFVAGGLLAYLIFNFNRTEENLADSLIDKSMQKIVSELDNFFSEVTEDVKMASRHASLGQLDNTNPQAINSYFAPILLNANQVKHIALANTNGYEYAVYKEGNSWINDEIRIEEWGNKLARSSWVFDSITHKWINGNKIITDGIDPRNSEWFSGSLNNNGNVFWSDVYLYTKKETGITASIEWEKYNSPYRHVIGFGIVLENISEFTQQLETSKNGKAFIISHRGELVGLPKHDKDNYKKYSKSLALQHIDSTYFSVIKASYKYWNNNISELTNAFSFTYNDVNWYGDFVEYHLSETNYLNIGVVIPKSDILSELENTKRIIIGSFIFILILTVFVFYSYGMAKKANAELAIKNIHILEQKILIEKKNKNILSSIQYAKRLQQAMLPPLEHVDNLLKESFILYKPKDIVAGDFYWMEKKGDTLFFAAADCTGHGVPGAMVSVVCIKALNLSVQENNKISPSEILNNTRDLVIEDFKKSASEVKDGMDIALCSLNGNKLQYAGANNPLWIIRDGKIIEIKADKQPIGNYIKQNPYTNHEFELQKGDTIYIFSDGYVDQFGGPDEKKFKARKLRELLLSIQSKSMTEQKEVIDKIFEEWKGSLDQIDDVCMWGVRI